MTVERRGFRRRKPDADEPLARTRLRTGPELEIMDIGDGGLGATTSSRLLPGTHVDVHVLTKVGRLLRRARVMRALVVLVEAERLVYQVALSFDAPIDSAPARVVPTPWRTDGPREEGDAIPAGDETRLESPSAALSAEAAGRVATGMGIGQGPA